MAVEKSFFGNLDESTPIYFYKITNKNGASVTLQTLGAGIHSLFMPDREGKLADVVLGFDDPKYYINPDYGYQGLVVGRWANRIRDGKFTFDSKEYITPKNQGTWTLHGGGRFSFTPWEVEETGENFVTFMRFSPDGEDGFCGNFTMRVKYTLDDNNILRLEYGVLSDIDTVANPTNHAYFNLSGDKNRTVEDEYLLVNADYFTETDENQLPTGELGEVKDTMMDFTALHKIGDNIDVPFRAIIEGIGYDNNYCLRNKDGKMQHAATLYDEITGRKMEVFTDLPGIQVYCGGWLKSDYTAGKENGAVSYRRGVALETQFYPDTVNIKDFPIRTVKAN
ncbi:MAG: galactose mutarotase [Eubacterium sp.]|nr:galactose mutarotase [Eubacterium sp.]